MLDNSLNLSFKSLQETDLNLLIEWFDKPHVKEWWNDKLTDSEIKEKYGNRIGSNIIVPFIVYLEDKPIGFIQHYHADKVEQWWADAEEGTIGIDQFIGEENYINRGIGTEMIRAYIIKLFADPDIQIIITEVDPDNHRAFRVYKKVGFKFVKEMMTPDGLAYLLEIRRHPRR